MNNRNLSCKGNFKKRINTKENQLPSYPSNYNFEFRKNNLDNSQHSNNNLRKSFISGFNVGNPPILGQRDCNIEFPVQKFHKTVVVKKDKYQDDCSKRRDSFEEIKNKFDTTLSVQKSRASSIQGKVKGKLDVMEFISNLKNKDKNKKKVVPNQIKPKSTQELISTKILLTKKLQKYQKEAIDYFYLEEYDQCFNLLKKCEELLQTHNFQSKEHTLYLSYLYCQFYSKLDEEQNFKKHLRIANGVIKELSIEEVEKLNSYIINIKIMNIWLVLDSKQFQKALKFLEDFMQNHKGELEKSSKIRRRISSAKIKIFQELYRIQEAIQAIQEQQVFLWGDSELLEPKKSHQLTKLFWLKLQLHLQYNSTHTAITQIQTKMNWQSVSKGFAQYFDYYNRQIFQLFEKLIIKENQLVKLAFFYENWKKGLKDQIFEENDQSVKEKITIKLFYCYYDMAIYEKCEEILQSQESCFQFVSVDISELSCLAQIKKIKGQQQDAAQITLKILEICENQKDYLRFTLKLLSFQIDQQLRKQKELSFEKIFLQQELDKDELQMYEQFIRYLEERGQQQKINILGEKMMKKTANFCRFYDQQSEKTMWDADFSDKA